ncbi:hypothetical protein ALP04_101830 [Pseudomonas amygdali pv. sesami]|nr:hypothetical protein ALP04_101830 [Pseudomonas amygdali pv. sesami]
MIGLDLLAVDPGAGLLGNRRQLFGSAGNLRDAVTNTGNQLAQGGAHALDALLQYAQFVTSGDGFGMSQVASSDALDNRQRVAQRPGNLPGNDDGRKNAQQHDQQHATDLQITRLSGVILAHLHLNAIQLFAQFDDGSTLGSQVLTHARSSLSGGLESLDRAAVATKSAFKLGNLFAVGSAKSGFEPVQMTDRRIQLLKSCCLGLVIGVAGITTYFIANQNQVLPGGSRQLGLIKTRRVRRIDLHDGIVQRVDSPHGNHGIGGHLVTHFGASLKRSAHAVQRGFIVTGDIGQFAQRLEVERVVEADEQ